MGFKARLLEEMRKVFFATAYFLVGFNLLVILVVLLAPGGQSLGEAILTATLLALVVGKVVVIADGYIDRVVRRGGSFLGAVAQRAALFTACVGRRLRRRPGSRTIRVVHPIWTRMVRGLSAWSAD